MYKHDPITCPDGKDHAPGTMNNSPNQKKRNWAGIAIGAVASCFAAYGTVAIVTQYHVGRTKRGVVVEFIGMSAVGLGLLFVGAACLMASLVLPQRMRLPAIVVGSVVMVVGIFGAILG